MIRIAMWSGPRNISTAMMRSWESRTDTFVIDEPYYAYYLSQTNLDHPGRDDVIRDGQLDSEKVSLGLVNDTNGDCSVYYQKHITHHILDSIDRKWMKSVTNCFLIRDPKDMIISYSRVHPDLNMHFDGGANASSTSISRVSVFSQHFIPKKSALCRLHERTTVSSFR